MERRLNALYNCKNPFQGKEKKILTVCSAGLLRAPTIAWFLGQHGYNTRSCGIHDYALIRLDEVLLTWADIIIFANSDIRDQIKLEDTDTLQVITFNIPDEFEYKDKILLFRIEGQCIKHKLIPDGI